VLIPHQHTNVHDRVTSVGRPVRNIGYTGHWRNLGAANQQVFDHIAAWGQPKGIAFKTIDYFQYKNVGRGAADVYKQVCAPFSLYSEPTHRLRSRLLFSPSGPTALPDP
jgi:hypothetical protein